MGGNVWNLFEIAVELETTEEVLLEFLDVLAIERRKRYSEQQYREISSLWYSSGAHDQYQEEGKLTTNSRKVPYLDHVASPEFARVRLATFSRDGWRCSICGTADETLQSHHEVYAALNDGTQGGKEEVRSCRTLCRRCHSILHGKSRNMT